VGAFWLAIDVTVRVLRNGFLLDQRPSSERAISSRMISEEPP